ncbi:hypothetical protein OAV88_01850 [bacterium]|nr:hypothetical protein [bacterium]
MESRDTNSNGCSNSQDLNSMTHCDVRNLFLFLFYLIYNIISHQVQCMYGYVPQTGQYDCSATGVLTNTLSSCNEIVCNVTGTLGT